jgi:hypothetical protein
MLGTLEQRWNGKKGDTNFTNWHEFGIWRYENLDRVSTDWGASAKCRFWATNEIRWGAGRGRCAKCHRDWSGSEEVVFLFGHAENPSSTGM